MDQFRRKTKMVDDRLELVKPAREWESQWRSMCQERAETDEIGASGYTQTVPPEDFGELLRRYETQETRDQPGRVRQTTYWLVRSEKVIGESRLRHSLTPELEQHGGHIGYMIRPSERRKAYGTAILKLTLEKARGIGLERALITCSPNNIGSVRVAERSGGVRDTDGIEPDSGQPTRRYWIDL